MSDKNNCFKEAVCIEVQRVFDSCSDRDCIYELPVTLSEDSPAITDEMNIVRTRCVEVEATCISVDSVPFKSGYYSVDITYRFKITAEAFSKSFCQPHSGTLLCGTALWNKRVILYGGEGSSKVFTSDDDFVTPLPAEPCNGYFCTANAAASMPKATIHVVDPVALDAKFICVPAGMSGGGVCKPPQPPAPPVQPPMDCCCPPPPPPQFDRVLAVSLGLFSIIQLSRPVSMIVPAYDYCIPCKDCAAVASSEAPCDVFDRIEFPTEQFFPQPGSDDGCKYTCSGSGVQTTAAANSSSE
ncbi:MAG: hypothetical protein NC085_06395 [Muribaculaceae bacterium]|nr:hypothetical protein [Muribaculaceae bacterium]